VHRLADEARATLGGVDILVNNAALYPQHTWFDGSADIWSRLFEVNVMAAVHLIQSTPFLPDSFERQKSSGGLSPKPRREVGTTTGMTSKRAS